MKAKNRPLCPGPGPEEARRRPPLRPPSASSSQVTKTLTGGSAATDMTITGTIVATQLKVTCHYHRVRHRPHKGGHRLGQRVSNQITAGKPDHHQQLGGAIWYG